MLTRSFNSTLDRMLTLNRAIDQAFGPTWTGERAWAPALDVVEKKDAYEVHAELPGVDRSQIEVKFEKNVLTIRGTKNSKATVGETADVRVYAAERVSGSFERSIRLPEFVDGEQITATLENGLLTVSVPKAKKAHARTIVVGSAEPSQS
jgi:HSP20 family protein